MPLESRIRTVRQIQILNDPDFIRPLTVSTRLLSPNKSAKISSPGRDLVDDGAKKRTCPEHSPQLDFLLRCPPSLGRSHPGTQRPGCLYHRSRGIERGQRAAQGSPPGAHGSPKKNVCLSFRSYGTTKISVGDSYLVFDIEHTVPACHCNTSAHG